MQNIHPVVVRKAVGSNKAITCRTGRFLASGAPALPSVNLGIVAIRVREGRSQKSQAYACWIR